MIYELVPFHHVGDHIAGNIYNHYTDMDRKDDFGGPKVDWGYYLRMSHAGDCVVIIAVDDNNKIVAYSVFITFKNPNHQDTVHANSAAIFIEKEYRGKIAVELIKKSDGLLRSIGVTDVMYLMGDDRIGSLLKRAGYTNTKKLWSK